MTQRSLSSIGQYPPMLIVEDSHEDYEAIQRYLQRSPLAIPVQRCASGDDALALLYHTGQYVDLQRFPRPGLIVLDLNLPGTDGREVLRRIKQDDSLKTIPVIVFTTSSNPKDVEVCYQYGVDHYIVKPIDFQQLKRDVQSLIDYWFAVAMPSETREDIP